MKARLIDANTALERIKEKKNVSVITKVTPYNSIFVLADAEHIIEWIDGEEDNEKPEKQEEDEDIDECMEFVIEHTIQLDEEVLKNLRLQHNSVR